MGFSFIQSKTRASHSAFLKDIMPALDQSVDRLASITLIQIMDVLNSYLIIPMFSQLIIRENSRNISQ